MDVTAIQGDIAEQSADVLVNAAGTSLTMGTGVAGALLDAANGPIEQDAVAERPIERGEVVVTDAYDLDAEYVLHAAAMSHSGPHPIATEESVRAAARRSLETADTVGAESIVLPLLGCGAGGFPTREGARFVCEEIRDYRPDDLSEARVIGYTDREYRTIEGLLPITRSSSGAGDN